MGWNGITSLDISLLDTLDAFRGWWSDGRCNIQRCDMMQCRILKVKLKKRDFLPVSSLIYVLKNHHDIFQS